MPEEVVNQFETAADQLENAGNAGEEQSQEQEESATSSANEGEQEQEQERKHKGGFQRRIDKLTREKADKERELEYWRNAALGKQPETKKAEAPAEDAKPVKPKMDDFKDWTEYEAAKDDYYEKLAEYKADQKLKAAKAKDAEESQKQKQADEWTKVSARGRELHDDFDDVVLNPETQKHLTPVMAGAVMSSDSSAELAYYLGEHPEEAARIAKLSDIAQAKEIGKLEVRLAGEQSAPEQKESKAPKPPTPVSKTTGVKAFDLNDPNTDFREWKKEREAQLAKRNR